MINVSAELTEDSIIDSSAASALRIQISYADGRKNHLILQSGQSLLAGLRESGVLQGVCGGKKSCGSCRVGISPEWMPRLDPPDPVEARLLRALDKEGLLDRLACQIELHPGLDGLSISMP
ncbi:MAG: 2Fe-2S iron-sulfur cluster-binding protein [Methylomonas sp.]|jgi:CDP-4-dehydro-6-deoxyglucose reductase